jgi:hypothetical protein
VRCGGRDRGRSSSLGVMATDHAWWWRRSSARWRRIHARWWRSPSLGAVAAELEAASDLRPPGPPLLSQHYLISLLSVSSHRWPRRRPGGGGGGGDGGRRWWWRWRVVVVLLMVAGGGVRCRWRRCWWLVLLRWRWHCGCGGGWC